MYPYYIWISRFEYPTILSQIPQRPSVLSSLFRSLKGVVCTVKGEIEPIGYFGGREKITFPLIVYYLSGRLTGRARDCGCDKEGSSLIYLSSLGGDGS